MNYCFLCGKMDGRRAKEFHFNVIDNAVGSILSKNKIHKVYTCNRNMFDDVCEDAVIINSEDFSVNLYLVDALPSDRTDDDNYDGVVYPFSEELLEEEKFIKLYKWLIPRCEYMLTYINDDEPTHDLSYEIRWFAERAGVKIINLHDILPKEIR